MTAHDIGIYKPCAVCDRTYKDSPKEFFMVEHHAWPGGAIRTSVNYVSCPQSYPMDGNFLGFASRIMP